MVAQLDDLDLGSYAGSRSACAVAAASRSASSRVDDGWLRPARDDGERRAVVIAAGSVASDASAASVGAAASEACVGGVRARAAGRRAANSRAQHRHDLLAEDVQLLEHGLQRQAGVVDQEQLALVVADDLAEAERPVDDLLRAAHGQRRLAM